ncbi:glycosyltransferase [Pseudorhodoferax soli]|uniref:Glycosyltransferase involved in cell wall biosynthesis n=1 Tax=Pseudorhodoferax soli TaxID=545864 RepID=A0A368Y8M6_9BURK|nr:glycosyltransferase [Pseudorhodoferax soli]RCW76552.1 glycosyltransferase involved in cell wall biosynthesis [Pseudorhodoferax soli]
MHFGDLALKILAQEKLSVLLFHAVPSTTTELVNDLTLASFERVIDYVSEHFTVVPLDEAAAALKTGRLPRRAACITFDDGYDSWLSGAVPLLRQRNLHATFFITTGQFDNERMWHERVAHALANHAGPVLDLPGFGLPQVPLGQLQERRRALSMVEQLLKYQPLHVRDKLLHALEASAGTRQDQLCRMTVEQLRDLHAQGFGVGAHTVRHPILSLCDDDDAMHEIGGAREVLEHLLRAPVKAFAYPNGRPGVDFRSEHVRMVQAAGYTHAVTTEGGAANRQTSVFEIPRFTPWGPSDVQMGVQMARNLMAKSRRVMVASSGTPAPDKKATDGRDQRPLVAFVENGAGFGGAVVALQTLLSNSHATGYRYHVVTNMPVGDFTQTAEESVVIPDRAVDYRAMARRVRARLGAGLLARGVLFALGRADDLTNRLPYFLRLVAHLLKVRPAIVHGNNDPSANREAMMAARLLGIPYIQHVRGSVSDSLALPMMRNGPATFIPVSRWLTGELLRSGVPAERIRQIYDGIDLAAQASETTPDLRTELDLPEDTILIAMVGMLVAWKGQDLFLDALAALQPSAKARVIALVVGDTPERGDASYARGLHARAEELGLSDRVRFLGRRNDLQSLLPQINISVSASTSPEPLGLVMLEALAHGCLFVGPAFGAACEVTEDGTTGFLFKPGSAASLAAKLELAIERAASPRAGAQQDGRDLIDRQFSGARCARSTSWVHQHLLDAR